MCVEKLCSCDSCKINGQRWLQPFWRSLTAPISKPTLVAQHKDQEEPRLRTAAAAAPCTGSRIAVHNETLISARDEFI